MRATARAQPNIALIKYWGKRDVSRNLPAVGSISITLDELFTSMCVELDAALPCDVLTVNGTEDAGMLPRVSQCLDAVLGEQRDAARVISECNFPIAAGLASSASAFAALVVAADSAGGGGLSTAALASLAGSISGSAARSLLGGYVELENAGDENIRLRNLCSAADWPLSVVVAVTQTAPKPIGSGDAMEVSRNTSPFYGRWIEQQEHDLAVAREAIAGQDFAALGSIAEHNCLKMHSVMWGSRPPMIYWNSATLECMQTVRKLQSENVSVFFTIDAGPQVKAVCTPDAEPQVRQALLTTLGVQDVMVSGIGSGAAVCR
jgi:diphosphomevalonate decarboxylase